MKCIKNVSTGEIRRTSTENAENLVDTTNVWEFCPKSEWKIKVRDVKRTKPTEV